MDRTQDWARLLGLGRTYGLLGELFDDEFLPQEARGWRRDWREAMRSSGGEDALEAPTADLLAALHEASARHEETMGERSRLLLLGECPAYETAYANGFARQRELADIHGFYRAFGLNPTGERGDHLAVECEFASLLCVKEAIARAAGHVDEADRTREARKAFLRDHLGSWLSLYEQDLRSRARLRLLPVAAAALHALVRWDAEGLGLVLHEREQVTRGNPEADPACVAPAADAA